MNIGILGAGLIGGTLGSLWAREGHHVIFSYSRQPAKLAALAQAAGGVVGTPASATQDADVLLLAVHWSRIDDVLEQAIDLSGKLVINCCVPLNPENSDLVVGTSTSGAEVLARRVPTAHWVATFNTVPSEALQRVYDARAVPGERPQLLVCGDDPLAKSDVYPLISGIGFEPLDAGGLHSARFIEPFAMVTAVLAYDQPGGAELTYRFRRWDEQTSDS